MTVQMTLKRIIISDIEDRQFLELREQDGTRKFTIVIGPYEAHSIDRRVKRHKSPRPLTHDLVVHVIEEMGGELRDILISDLREGTYFAKLRVLQNGEVIEIDSRPSDAIAVAVTASVPIYVAEEVLREATRDNP